MLSYIRDDATCSGIWDTKLLIQRSLASNQGRSLFRIIEIVPMYFDQAVFMTILVAYFFCTLTGKPQLCFKSSFLFSFQPNLRLFFQITPDKRRIFLRTSHVWTSSAVHPCLKACVCAHAGTRLRRSEVWSAPTARLPISRGLARGLESCRTGFDSGRTRRITVQ